MLNSSKCVVKANSIPFFSRQYAHKGIYPNPKKVEDITSMPPPQDKQELQRFLSMVTFLSNHVPNFSDHTDILRDHLNVDIPFEWSEDHQHTFALIKQLIVANIGLRYYDPTQEVSLEVDASSKGLGAALVQGNSPVVFASKALTPTEANYSNIERECLTVVHGIQHFHYYLFGKSFIVNSDHKPLEMIFRKPIHAVPPRLQRMMLKSKDMTFELSIDQAQNDPYIHSLWTPKQTKK